MNSLIAVLLLGTLALHAQEGARRKVLTGIAGRTDVAYTLDRETGELLWAPPTVFQNVISTIDGGTRRK